MMTTKAAIVAAVVASVLRRAAAQPVAALASQTFFIPMPEDFLLNHTFVAISTDAVSPVATTIAIAISTDDTKLFWDHWEDGYEADATNPSSKTTQIWGDGDPSNGCVPTKPCTAAGDKLFADDVIILNNDVPTPRNKANIFYDGGDRLQASYPVTVTRSAFPRNPGSHMAGAVEVLDTTLYGTQFNAPAGEDSPIMPTPAFEYCVLYVLASEDNTVVTRPDGTTRTLNRGQTLLIEGIKLNQKVSTSKPVLVDFVTGDRKSHYELRWFSLLDTNMWDTDYLAPVGDSVAKTRIVLYNPGTSSLTVTYSFLNGGVKTTKTVTVAAGGNAVTPDFIPSGSACRLTAPSKFIALSIHDTVSTGDTYDWGYPVMPVAWLTNQVIISLGYGCTNNACPNGQGARNVVWVSPVKDAWVHADYNNDGVIDNTTFCKELTGTIFQDLSDKDLSGSRFFATETNSITGVPVNIAAAWGQNGAFSFSGDDFALDMGTVALPFKSIRVTKSVKLVADNDMNGAVSPGDKLEYVIQVVNVGPSLDVPTGGYTVLDNQMPTGATYIPGTFSAKCSHAGVLATSDDSTGTAFPLDGTGFVSKGPLLRRGGTHDYKFQVIVNEGTGGTNLVNRGIVKQPGNPDLPFEVSTPVIPKLVWDPTPPSPPTGSCMSDSYKYYGKTGALSCTAKNIFLESVESTSAKQCVAGTNIKLTLSATVKFNSGAWYDPGWYIAKDGGDALTGKCAVGFLDQKYQTAIKVTESSCLNLNKGTVTWVGDANGGNDECGDVVVEGTSGGVMNYNILIDTELQCKDTDKDGKMDFSICFGWKNAANDNICRVASKLAAGLIPELYPGTTDSCFCAQVDIPNVVVLTPGTKVYPCA